MARLGVCACLLLSVVLVSCGQARAEAMASSAVAGRDGPSPAAPLSMSRIAPSPAPVEPWAWTAKAVEVLAAPDPNAPVQVHLGPGFSVALTTRSADVEGRSYVEVAWASLARSGKGWLPAEAVTRDEPQTVPSAGIDALDAGLHTYLAALGSRVGVQVLDISRGTSYSYNATKGFAAASSIKVPIMLTFLHMMETQRREPNAAELALLTAMIEHSDNEAAIDLYAAIGAPRSIIAYMKHLGVSGVTPSPGNVVFGLSPISPAGMVSLLDKLRSGEALNEVHTRLALNLMTPVVRGQQVGVGDTRPAGSTVAMKDGWYWFGKEPGTVMNTSGIVTADSEVYIVSVYTDHNNGLDEGWRIVRHVCSAVAGLLAPPVRPYA